MASAPLLKILSSFEIPDKDYNIQELRQGLINDTYLVSGKEQTEYILQRINTKVFKDVRALMGNLDKALPLLVSEDYHPIELLKTKNGGLFLETEDQGAWRMMSFIPGSLTFNITSNENTAREAGRIIGRFHYLLNSSQPGDFALTLPGFQDLQQRSEQFAQALETAGSARKQNAQIAISLASDFLEEPMPVNWRELRIRVCHNDTKLNNILYDQDSGRALCLIDLDTIMAGYFLYDFGDAVRTIVNPVPEDERMLEKIGFSRSLFKAFADGISSHPGLLDKQEVESLPWGAIYMPLLHGLRALTDYLTGDVYYQVSYEGQNLDRSMSLLTFAKKAKEQLPFMQEVVRERLL